MPNVLDARLGTLQSKQLEKPTIWCWSIGELYSGSHRYIIAFVHNWLQTHSCDIFESYSTAIRTRFWFFSYPWTKQGFTTNAGHQAAVQTVGFFGRIEGEGIPGGSVSQQSHWLFFVLRVVPAIFLMRSPNSFWGIFLVFSHL